MHLGDVSSWARGSGLEIILLVTGAAILGRFAHWASRRYVARLDRRVHNDDDDLATYDEIRHLHTLAQAIEWMTVGLIYFVAAVLVIIRFDLPLSTLVAPATAIGAAIGFGSQRVVQDLLAGFFLFTENQYVFGDVVQIAPVGQTTGITGTVEEVTLRTTRLRTVKGELVIIPNGQVTQVTNRSRDWSRVIIDVPIGLDQDVDKAADVLRREVAAVAEDDAYSQLLLEAPIVAGVEDIQAGYLQLRVTVRTLPTRQLDVGREMRRRIAQGLREAGISSTATIA